MCKEWLWPASPCTDWSYRRDLPQVGLVLLFPVTCPRIMTGANQNQHLGLVAKCHWAQKQKVGQKQMVSNWDSPWHWCKCTMHGSMEQLWLPIYAVLNEPLTHNPNCGLPSPFLWQSLSLLWNNFTWWELICRNWHNPKLLPSPHTVLMSVIKWCQWLQQPEGLTNLPIPHLSVPTAVSLKYENTRFPKKHPWDLTNFSL